MKKEKIKIDNLLTWENTMPSYLDILSSDRYPEKSKELVKEELMRLAKLVDELNKESVK